MANQIAVWLLPPLNVLVLLIAGLVIRRWRPGTGIGLLIAGTAVLWISGTPFLAERSLRSLEVQPPTGPLTGTGATAIVVIAGGSYLNAPEYGMDTVGAFTLERLRYAARLHRQTSLPVLVSGGTIPGARSSEAEQMREALEHDLATPVKWTEQDGATTLDNAVNSEKLLREDGVKKILLVTHAWHMGRARLAFEGAGLDVVPAPMGYATHAARSVLEASLPSAYGIWMTRVAWREAIGMNWYRLRFAFS
jgi:uncharacterized SAM-binding protein YcdF (DUF218 family)